MTIIKTETDSIAKTDIMIKETLINDQILHSIPTDHLTGTDTVTMTDIEIKHHQDIEPQFHQIEKEPQVAIDSLGQTETTEMVKIIEEISAKIRNQKSDSSEKP